jgi:hypothetical protein
MSPRHAKSQPTEDIIKQTKLPVTPTAASKTQPIGMNSSNDTGAS